MDDYQNGWNEALDRAILIAEEEYRDSSQEDVARIIEAIKNLRPKGVKR